MYIRSAYEKAAEEKFNVAAEEEDVDTKAERLVSIMMEACKETVHEVEKAKKKWITQETLRLIAGKRLPLVFKEINQKMPRKRYKTK